MYKMTFDLSKFRAVEALWSPSREPYNYMVCNKCKDFYCRRTEDGTFISYSHIISWCHWNWSDWAEFIPWKCKKCGADYAIFYGTDKQLAEYIEELNSEKENDDAMEIS